MQTPPDDTSRPIDDTARPFDDTPRATDTPPPAPPVDTSRPADTSRPVGTAERPLGVTIIAVLSAIGGFFGLLASLVFLGLGAAGTTSDLGGLAFLAGLIILAYSLLSLALAYGFWTLKPWAWPLGVGVQVLGIVQAVLQFLNDGTQFFSLLVSLAIAGVILWYLFQPHVKAAFGRT